MSNSEMSIVYSFDSRWFDDIRKGSIEVFFRKRRPKTSRHLMFFYLNAPISSIIGFAKIKNISPVTRSEALAVANKAKIEESEINQYFGGLEHINAIWIANPVIFKSPVSRHELMKSYGFSPPQNFSNVDEDFQNFLLGQTIDE